VIEIYKLGGSIDLNSWMSGLERHNPLVRGEDRAERAPWTGKPFVIAGNKESLTNWFNSLDTPSAEVIRDHAYYWVLTSHSGFEHRLLAAARLTVLDWRMQEHNVIHEALHVMDQFPRLAGLSEEMHHLREEILRIGTGAQEPATPVLIFGETGSGKEGTAQSLFDACSRPDEPGLYSIGGAWLKIESGMAEAELFGIEKGAAPGVVKRAGLVERYSKGAIFIDDFDTAPPILQERLLRLTSTSKGQSAPFQRMGGTVTLHTDVWLIFATNRNITEMLKKRRLRMDFLFRFEDRVLVVPPLRDRPADLPAIAYRIWNSLAAAAGDVVKDRVLSWRSLRSLHSRKVLEWKGNVRELSALLSLVVSMCKMPKHRHESTGTLLEQVLARGPSYMEWFGILGSKEYTSSPPRADRTEQIRALDLDPETGELSACEKIIREKLGNSRWEELEALVRTKVRRNRDRIRRNLCRYLVFALTFDAALTKAEAVRLSGLKDIQAGKQLGWLSAAGQFLAPAKNSSKSKLIYGPGTYFA